MHINTASTYAVKNRVGVFRPVDDEKYESLKTDKEGTVINKNSKVAEIKEVQRTLIVLNFKGDMDEANLGEWGSRTEKALNAFQTSVNLPIGNEVDPATAAAMFKALREKAVDAEANYAGYQDRVSSYVGGIKTAVNMKI
jgi:peptidoglycan hydrolase-like protein with peptidoglycan-binding domain